MVKSEASYSCGGAFVPVFWESRGALFLPFFSKIGVVVNGRDAMDVMRSGRERLEGVSELDACCYTRTSLGERTMGESAPPGASMGGAARGSRREELFLVAFV